MGVCSVHQQLSPIACGALARGEAGSVTDQVEDMSCSEGEGPRQLIDWSIS